jgi:hypothetical protein
MPAVTSHGLCRRNKNIQAMKDRVQQYIYVRHWSLTRSVILWLQFSIASF